MCFACIKRAATTATKEQAMTKKYTATFLILTAVVLVRDGAIFANEDRKVPAARVVWQLVGKTLINPATGDGQVLGYFTFIEGVRGPMFAGPVGEATAFFTLRSDPFGLQIVPHGDILIGLLGDEQFKLYLDESPDQNFGIPESFSDGQQIAHFNRLPAQIQFVGPVFTDTFSSEFISSRTFTREDRRVNLRHLTPEGVTLTITGSTAFLPSGVPDFPFSVSFGAAAVAIGH
jgi:hypothetical protein